MGWLGEYHHHSALSEFATCARNHGRPRPNGFTGRARNFLPPHSLLSGNAHPVKI